MRLLQVHHSFAPPFADVARSYAAAAELNGWAVHTVVLTGEPVDGLAGEVTALALPHSALSGLKLGALAAFRRALPGGVSLIIAHRFKPLYLAALGASAPLVGVAHEFGFCRRVSRRLLLRFLGQRLRLAGVSRAVTVELGAAIGAARTLHLGNVLDTTATAVERSVARARLIGDARASDTGRWIAHVGRLHPKKSLPVLIDAFAQLRRIGRFADLRLLLVGDGPERGRLMTQVAALGLERDVLFAGFIPDAGRLLGGVDLLVQCSGAAEAFGMTVLEAVRAGTPVVTPSKP